MEEQLDYAIPSSMTSRNKIEDKMEDKNKQKPMRNNLTDHMNMMLVNEVQSL